MNPVVTGRIEHCFKPAWHAVDRFSMNPELVKQVQATHEEYDIGMKADDDHGEADPDKSGQWAKPGLA